MPEELRAQDGRGFTTPAVATTFSAMPGLPTDVVEMADSSRGAGILKGAAYMVEVPTNWNGKLLMFAHGYAGTGSALSVAPPAIRRHLVATGYAWSGSS
ncbi:hypothetical protein [Polaromonas sp.]|uniref:hypothetical protein n=1 Tax=Polaromonas sp. TaxID=1869339 RepID=UPI0025D7B29F|nr:hypothetical protein [Polaromonas sp.]